MDSTQNETVCGIILICGYLGAGKTTLVQHLLKHQNKYKVAVIQNEYSNGKIDVFYSLNCQKWVLKVP